MKSLINSVRLMGRLGSDPEIKTFDSGRKMTRVSLATNEVYRSADGEKITDTQWHSLVFWAQHAEIAEKYLQKGKELAIEGKLVTRDFVDKEGRKHFVTEIVVNEFMMLGKKEQSGKATAGEAVPADSE
ncbi:MAG TPA: single-stranded DNA-binding protein [Anseongella sp.]